MDESKEAPKETPTEVTKDAPKAAPAEAVKEAPKKAPKKPATEPPQVPITLRNRIEYAGLMFGVALFRIVPIKVMGSFIYGIIWLLFHTIWPQKKKTVARMREVFGPETSISRIRWITIHTIWNFTMNYVEIIRSPKMDKAYLEKHVEGLDVFCEHVQSVIDKHGKGGIFALSHTGSWDFAGNVFSIMFERPLLALARVQDNPLIEKWITRNRLVNFEAMNRKASQSFIRAIHCLKDGGFFALLPDVRHNQMGISTTVFGKKDVQLPPGLVRFSRMANVPIIPLIMERIDETHHRMICPPLIFPDMEADADEDAKRIMQTLWDMYEKEIRKAPEHWFWHNKRWILEPLPCQVNPVPAPAPTTNEATNNK